MRDYITQKLKAQYLKQQRLKLDADPYWKHLHRLMHDVVVYPAFPINGMDDCQSEPCTRFRSLQAQGKDYLDTMYPYLSDRPQGLISYVKYHGTEPWYEAMIIEPGSLSLPAIDKRLDLFKEWLRYKLLVTKHHSDFDFWYYKEELGIMFIDTDEQPLSFDEWLYYNNYDRLVHVIFSDGLHISRR